MKYLRKHFGAILATASICFLLTTMLIDYIENQYVSLRGFIFKEDKAQTILVALTLLTAALIYYLVKAAINTTRNISNK